MIINIPLGNNKIIDWVLNVFKTRFIFWLSSQKKTVVYDPAKSETYKMLQDQELGDHVQEVTTPIVTKVFSPVKVNLYTYSLI